MKNTTTNETFFRIENDYIGYYDVTPNNGKFHDYLSAVNELHNMLQDVEFNWVNKEYPKSKWAIEMATGNPNDEDYNNYKKTIVYSISASKAKKLIRTVKFI